jgi:hypothetical protein
VNLLVQVAHLIEMKITTEGDRMSEDAHATPFTVLSFEIEQHFLSSIEDKSPNLQACAQRIVRILSSPPRQNSSKT